MILGHLHTTIHPYGKRLLRRVWRQATTYVILLFSFIHFTAAQQRVADTAIAAKAVQNAIQLYSDSLGKTMLLYTGAEYIRSAPGARGHPFFEWEGLQKGSILYDGVLYTDVPLGYDLMSQQVLTSSYFNINIQLDPHKIGHFTIGGHLFIPADSIHAKPNIGFYEVCLDEQVKVLAYHKKGIARALHASDPDNFVMYTTYYIQKNVQLLTIESERALLAALADKKDELKKWIRRSDLNFKKMPAQTIKKTVAYYNQLNQ